MTTSGRKGVVTFGGKPVTLVGRGVKVGSKAPDFTAVDGDFKPVKLSSFAGRPVLISSVASLDTGICADQTRRFEADAAKIRGAVVLTVSMDLPFAQKRFCAAAKLGGALVLSDIVNRSFGTKWGLIMKEVGILARSVHVVDRSGRIVYAQITPEVATHPDYEAALAALRICAKAR